ncbi:MAG: DUF1614 domain-containing protein [Candidatus Binataceae bacterium]
MYPPIALRYLGVFGLAALFLFALVELEIIEVAYSKLGMSHRAIVSLLLLTILGSYINIPVASIPAEQLVHDQELVINGIAYIVPHVVQVGRTVIAVNVGGALIPGLLSIYLLLRVGGAIPALIATPIVSAFVYHFSQVVPGVGIAVPTLVPGILAALLATALDYRRSAAVAYVAGTMGCLLGADIFNLGIISQMHAPVASIGGAGTFDGVFVSGVIAVLLA